MRLNYLFVCYSLCLTLSFVTKNPAYTVLDVLISAKENINFKQDASKGVSAHDPGNLPVATVGHSLTAHWPNSGEDRCYS